MIGFKLKYHYFSKKIKLEILYYDIIVLFLLHNIECTSKYFLVTK